jgi:flagellar motor switch protein FliG
MADEFGAARHNHGAGAGSVAPIMSALGVVAHVVRGVPYCSRISTEVIATIADCLRIRLMLSSQAHFLSSLGDEDTAEVLNKMAGQLNTAGLAYPCLQE